LLFILVHVKNNHDHATSVLGWEMSKEKMGIEEMVFDCGVDFSLCLSLRVSSKPLSLAWGWLLLHC